MKTDKPAAAPGPLDNPADLTCSESQLEDLLGEGESTGSEPGERARPKRRKSPKPGAPDISKS